MALNNQDYKRIGEILNVNLLKYNYQVTPTYPSGKFGKNIRSQREYRLQLINKINDTSSELIKNLSSILNNIFKDL